MALRSLERMAPPDDDAWFPVKCALRRARKVQLALCAVQSFAPSAVTR